MGLGFRNINNLGGYEDFVDILGGHDKIGLDLGVFPVYFKVFS